MPFLAAIILNKACTTTYYINQYMTPCYSHNSAFVFILHQDVVFYLYKQQDIKTQLNQTSLLYDRVVLNARLVGFIFSSKSYRFHWYKIVPCEIDICQRDNRNLHAPCSTFTAMFESLKLDLGKYSQLCYFNHHQGHYWFLLLTQPFPSGLLSHLFLSLPLSSALPLSHPSSLPPSFVCMYMYANVWMDMDRQMIALTVYVKDGKKGKITSLPHHTRLSTYTDTSSYNHGALLFNLILFGILPFTQSKWMKKK